jgi:hypothetical protein
VLLSECLDCGAVKSAIWDGKGWLR